MAELLLTTDATVPPGRGIDLTVEQSADPTTDSFTEVAESPNLRAHQGYTTDGSYHYSFDTEHVYKWTDSWDLAAENARPLADLPAEVNHLGDGDYDAVNDELHVPAVAWHSSEDNGAPHVAVYDADDLSFERAYPLESGSGGGSSGVWVDDAGGVAWVADFLDPETPLYEYDLADYSLVGSLTSTAGVPGVQGVFRRSGYFYLPSHETHTTHVLDGDGVTRREIAPHPGGAYEGVDYSTGTFRVLHDPNGDSEGHVHFHGRSSTADRSAALSIDDGRNTYRLDGFEGSWEEVRVEADLRGPDGGASPELHSVDVRSASGSAPSGAGDARNGVSRVVERRHGRPPRPE